jgi:hypothetical protein
MTFMLLDPAKNTPASTGGGGGGLGFANLSGVAVTFVTYPGNLIGISAGGSPPGYLVKSTAVPALRTGTHQVWVTVSAAGHLVVKIDGSQLFDTAVALPANALVGFSGATGSVTDVHAVSAVHIAY